MANATDSVVGPNSQGVKKPEFVDNKEVEGGDTPYIMQRQASTGTTRGTQSINGLLQIINPDTGKVIGIIGYSPGAF